MVELSIRKRQRKTGTVYEYRFEIATVDGKRKWETKCGFKTKADALKAGNAALSHYENFGNVIEKDEISFADYLDYWIENDCMIELKPNTVRKYKKDVDEADGIILQLKACADSIDELDYQMQEIRDRIDKSRG